MRRGLRELRGGCEGLRGGPTHRDGAAMNGAPKDVCGSGNGEGVVLHPMILLPRSEL